jgi:hypothetical protein
MTPQGSPWRTPSWEERGGASEGDPRTTRSPWARYVQAAKGRSRGARQATACNKACRETLLKAFWKSICRVTLPGQQERLARSAWPTHWLPPGTPTPSCRGARADPVLGQAAMAQRLARRSHTSPMAIGHTPRPPGFSRVMSAEALKEGRWPPTRGLRRSRMAEVAVGEVPVAARMWSYAHPLRPGPEERGRRSRTRWKMSSVSTRAGADTGGTRQDKTSSGRYRAARLARVAAEVGARGTASKTLAAREMLPRTRRRWPRAAVVWGDGAVWCGAGAMGLQSEGSPGAVPTSPARKYLRLVTTRQVRPRQAPVSDSAQAGRARRSATAPGGPGQPPGRCWHLFRSHVDSTRPVNAVSDGDGGQNTARGWAKG